MNIMKGKNICFIRLSRLEILRKIKAYSDILIKSFVNEILILIVIIAIFVIQL
jgi:hypothetical protein